MVYAAFSRLFTRNIRDRSLFSGEGGRGRYYIWGEGHNFFNLTLGSAIFFKMTLRGGLRFFLAHKYSVSIYLKSSTHSSLYLSQLYPFYVITHVNMEHCFTKSLYKAYLFSKTHNNWICLLVQSSNSFKNGT